MDAIGRASLVALLVGMATAHAAAPRLQPLDWRAALAAGTSLHSPATARLFRRHFQPSCIAVEGLPFDRTCTYIAPEHENDPSPWPEVFIALRGERIVAMVVADPAWRPAAWTCSPLPEFDRAHLCTPPDVPQVTHRAWRRRWSGMLRAAG